MAGIFPHDAMPAPTPAMFCSATPISKKRSGNFFAKASERVDSVKSQHKTTTLASRSPAATMPSPYPLRVGMSSTFFENRFGLRKGAYDILFIRVHSQCDRRACAIVATHRPPDLYSVVFHATQNHFP